jgi:hypothetical protein
VGEFVRATASMRQCKCVCESVQSRRHVRDQISLWMRSNTDPPASAAGERHQHKGLAILERRFVALLVHLSCLHRSTRSSEVTLDGLTRTYPCPRRAICRKTHKDSTQKHRELKHVCTTKLPQTCTRMPPLMVGWQSVDVTWCATC